MDGFSPEAMAAVQAAVEEAGGGVVHTGHLLLGCLMQGESLGARVMKSSGVTEEAVREFFGQISEAGDANDFTSECKEVLYSASCLAENPAGTGSITVEHLLVAIFEASSNSLFRASLAELYRTVGGCRSRVPLNEFPGHELHKSHCSQVGAELHAFCSHLLNSEVWHALVERDETKQHFYRVLELGGILGRAVRDYAGDLGAHQSIEPKDNLLDLWQLSVKSYLLMIEDGPPEVLELSALMKEMDAAVQTLSRSIEGQADMP